MSTMTDLMDWLREKIAEDKRSLDTRERYDCDDAAHAIWTDERVLAQCDAHEMVLTLAETVYVGYAAVQALALAYRHRPGYREEWRP